MLEIFSQASTGGLSSKPRILSLDILSILFISASVLKTLLDIIFSNENILGPISKIDPIANHIEVKPKVIPSKIANPTISAAHIIGKPNVDNIFIKFPSFFVVSQLDSIYIYLP